MINLTELWNKIKPYVFITIGLVIGYFLFKGCESGTTAPVDTVQLNKELAASKKMEVELLAKNDSLEIDKTAYKDSISKYKHSVASYEKEIALLKKSDSEKKQIVKSYDTNGYAEYFKKRYPEVATAVAITPAGLVMNDSILNPIANDLISGETAIAENKVKDKIIEEKDKTIAAKDSVQKASDKQNINLQAIIDQKNIDDEKQNKTIKDQQDSLNKKENQNLFWKITAGVAFGIGVLIGTK